MRNILLLVLSGLLLLPGEAAPLVSVFAPCVRSVARERGVGLREAADTLFRLGVRGFDAAYDDPDLAVLADSALRPVNLYYFASGVDAKARAEADVACLDAAVRHGVPRVMLIPPSFPKGADEETAFASILATTRSFVARAKERGVAVTVEDYGGTANPCSHLRYLCRLLDGVPDLRLTIDSGNLRYAGRGEDVLELLRYARTRLEHVHLKDQSAADGRAYVTLGTGSVPNERLVRGVRSSGYAGWYTLENPIGPDICRDVARQIAVLSSWLAPVGGTAEKSEDCAKRP